MTETIIVTEPHAQQAESYLRRIAALDCAAHGYWEGPPELDGMHDPLIERVLEMRQAWLGLYHTTLATEKIRQDHAQMMAVMKPEG